MVVRLSFNAVPACMKPASRGTSYLPKAALLSLISPIKSGLQCQARIARRSFCWQPQGQHKLPQVPSASKTRFSIADGGRIWRPRRTYLTRPNPGAEPGLDPSARHVNAEKLASAGHLQHGDISVVDFSSDQVEEHDVTREIIGGFMTFSPKPEWAACRWVFVNGLDVQLIRTLARHKDLHRLAVEDVLDTNSRTKADWYQGHLCAILTMQKLVDLQGAEPASAPNSTQPRDSLQQRYQNEAQKHRIKHPSHRSKFARNFASRHSPAVRIEQVSIFLTSDGTVITIFETMGKEVLKPVMDRLTAAGTILRSSNDPSMLVHAILDTIVDITMPIAGAYHNAIRDLEIEVLTNPKISQPRELYALRSDLALLDSVVKPIDSLVNTLRDHTYVAFLNNNPRAMHHHGSSPTVHAPKDDNLISPLAQAYLADVHDHVLVVSTSLAASMGSVENLTSLIFNTISARQNESIRQLTVVTIFFLPLSFLTGYFGMNFKPFPAVNEHSDLFFWCMAMPVMFLTLFTLTRGARARQFAHQMRQRWRRPGPPPV